MSSDHMADAMMTKLKDLTNVVLELQSSGRTLRISIFFW